MIPINQIICGDCLEVMKDWPDNCVDLVLTDPPYGVDLDNFKTRLIPSRPNSYHAPKYKYPSAHEWDGKRLSIVHFEQIFRLSINQVIFGANYYCNWLPPKYGWIFWDKLHGDGTHFSEGEIAFASKGVQVKRFQCSQFDGLKGGQSKTHPTQKPIRLMKWIVDNYSLPTDLILDPFCGSGTTCVAAKMLGRRYIGIDISPEYCKIAEERLREAETGVPVKEARAGQRALFE